MISVGFPALAEADDSTVVASANSSGREVTGKADPLECTAGLSEQQFCCHRATPEAQATATTRPGDGDDPVLAEGRVDFFPRAVTNPTAVFAKVASTFRVPRFLFGNFRS